ncbi:hypothetical protein KUC_3720 [Vreelandella boliviensis LC1]|uniref:Uncharacterized protein n=1 Tax=Vreelandella boliviensis LC1 TaxID=1072583 RepID=A0A7U9GEC4_9GAMM|nr:hypothetical protein KUC_3720 [Halomonas boliviensis LC1]
MLLSLKLSLGLIIKWRALLVLRRTIIYCPKGQVMPEEPSGTRKAQSLCQSKTHVY